MAVHPILPLFVADFDAAVTHLSAAEEGIYGRLLRLAWTTSGCTLPDDMAWISRRVRLSDQEFMDIGEPILREFFKLKRRRWVQDRLLREFVYVSEKKSIKKSSGKLGGLAKARKNKAKSASKPIAEGVANASTSLHFTSPPTVEGSVEAKASPATKAQVPLDPDAKAWSDGRELLIQRASMTKDAAGKFIGKLIQEHGLQARQLLPAINSAIANGTQAPKDYLVQSAARISNKKPRPIQQAPIEPVDLEWC